MAIALVLVACGGGTPPLAPTSAPVEKPVRRLTVDEVVPAQLADPGIVDRITRRVRVRRIGPAWLAMDLEPSIGDPTRDPPLAPMPVLDQARDRVRVVTDEDSARVSLWIRREDVLAAAVAEAQLTDARGRAGPDVGVWVEPGAQLELRMRGAGRREVLVVSEAVRATGWLADTAIGTVWTVRPAVPFAPTARLSRPTAIRTSPLETAPVVAETLVPVDVLPGEERDGWRTIELRREGIRVRGFVPDDHVFQQLLDREETIGLGSIYTISHTLRVEVAAGACLFDRADGDVVGVNTQTKNRLAHQRTGDWQDVYVGTPWGTRTVYLHFTGDTAESCLP